MKLIEVCHASNSYIFLTKIADLPQNAKAYKGNSIFLITKCFSARVVSVSKQVGLQAFPKAVSNFAETIFRDAELPEAKRGVASHAKRRAGCGDRSAGRK